MRCKSLITLLLSAFVLASLTACIREDTDECFAGLRLHFNFTLHNQGGNLFGREVQQVRVYLFDEQGVLRHIARDSGAHLTNDYVMEINVPPGQYTIVSWAGSNEDFLNSYFEGHMNDPMTHQYEDGVTPGRTTWNDFRVILKHNVADDLPEDLVPAVEELDDLYYGAVGTRTPLTDQYLFAPVEVKAGCIVEREIELIKNTNLIRLTVRGLEHLQRTAIPQEAAIPREAAIPQEAVIPREAVAPEHLQRTATPREALQVWITARNGRYKPDNSIGEYARSIRYTPHYQSVDNRAIVVDIKILRLDMARRTAQPVSLTVINPLTGIALSAEPLDVIQTLLQARNPETGEYIYQSQEDFDREYEHSIEIEITADLYLRIFVRGWEIIKLKPEL